MVFDSFQQHYDHVVVASAPIYDFSWIVLRTISFQSHWLLSDITTLKRMDSSERGMNPVAMTGPNIKFLQMKNNNKRAKMALDRSPEFLRGPQPFFFLAVSENFVHIVQVAPIHQSHFH